MTLRTGHGKGRGTPRIEVMPPDELPLGVPALPMPDAGGDRGPDGRWASGNEASRRGGQAKRQKVALVSGLGLKGIEAMPGFAPYRRAANAFRRAHCSTLARTVGGGFCGPGPSSMVASALTVAGCGE